MSKLFDDPDKRGITLLALAAAMMHARRSSSVLGPSREEHVKASIADAKLLLEEVEKETP